MEEQCWVIMQTHDDFQIMTEITIGYDKKENMFISLLTIDDGWDYPEGTWYTSYEETMAIMSPYEVNRLARRLRIKPEEVMNYLWDGFEDYDDFICKEYVIASFSNILNYILDHGAKYRLKRKYKRSCVECDDVEHERQPVF